MEANVRKYWDHSLYLSILKHNCANTQAYQFLLPSQPLCKMGKHGHHHVHVYMPALFGDANRTPQIRMIIFSRLTVSSKSHNEHHAVILIGVWWCLCFQKSWLYRNTAIIEINVFPGFTKSCECLYRQRFPITAQEVIAIHSLMSAVKPAGWRAFLYKRKFHPTVRAPLTDLSVMYADISDSLIIL